jgi:hypothetical protein
MPRGNFVLLCFFGRKVRSPKLQCKEIGTAGAYLLIPRLIAGGCGFANAMRRLVDAAWHLDGGRWLDGATWRLALLFRLHLSGFKLWGLEVAVILLILLQDAKAS